MIEIIYKEEKQAAKGNEELFSIPRNIRQIGLINGNYRIYLEDYVYTFLGRLSEKSGRSGENQGRLAVFTGESKWAEGITYVFVRGALELEDEEAAREHIDFTEKMWTKIHEEQELYFPEQEVVGWFFTQPELPMKITDLFTKVHLKHFAGGEKILMLMDPTEKEDAIFVYENDFMVKQEGYYLFYERNPQMQAYMMEKVQGAPEESAQEVPDKAVKAFREIIRTRDGKQKAAPEEREKTERPSVFSYAATACLVIAVLTVGGSFYRNYQEMRSLEKKADTLFETDADPVQTVETGGDGAGSRKMGSTEFLEEMSENLFDTGTALTSGGVLEASSAGEEERSGEGSSGSDKEGKGEDGGPVDGETETAERTVEEDRKTGAGVNGSGDTDSAENTDETSAGESAGGSSETSGGKSTGGSSETSGGESAGGSSETSGGESAESASETSGRGNAGGSSETSGRKSVGGNSGTSGGESAGGSSVTSGGKNAGGSGVTSGKESAGGSSETSGGKSAESGSGTAGSDSAENSGSGSVQAEDEDGIFQEESDVRKAVRRKALQEKTSEETSGTQAHTTYVIRPGDTLYEISMRKYGNIEAISEICRLNDISREEIIYPGQIIVLP